MGRKPSKVLSRPLLSEFVVIVTMCFLRCARDGVDFVSRAFDPRTRAGQYRGLGFITPLPRELWNLIKSFNGFDIVRASSFDAASSLLALQRSEEIDWSVVDLPERFLFYNFDTVEVFPLASMEVIELPPGTTRNRVIDDSNPRITRNIAEVGVVFTEDERVTLAHSRHIAQKFFLDVDASGSDPFVTADKGDDGTHGQSGVRESMVASFPDELPDNDFSRADDPDDDVVTKFTLFQQAFRDKGVDVASTVGRELTTMASLVRGLPVDTGEIAWLEQMVKAGIDARRALEKTLVAQASDLDKSADDLVHLQGT